MHACIPYAGYLAPLALPDFYSSSYSLEPINKTTKHRHDSDIVILYATKSEEYSLYYL